MKRSLEFKIYIGVPRVRNTMPPPLPTPVPPGGDCTCPPVCLRGGKDTSLYSGMDAGHTWHTAAAREHQRHRAPASAAGNEYATGSRRPAGLVSMQIVVLLWRDPLEIVEAIVASVPVLVVHLCLLWKPW